MDVSMKHTFSMLFSGERAVGKTEFTKKLLKNKIIAEHLNTLFGVMQSINKVCLKSL